LSQIERNVLGDLFRTCFKSEKDIWVMESQENNKINMYSTYENFNPISLQNFSIFAMKFMSEYAIKPQKKLIKFNVE